MDTSDYTLLKSQEYEREKIKTNYTQKMIRVETKNFITPKRTRINNGYR